MEPISALYLMGFLMTVLLGIYAASRFNKTKPYGAAVNVGTAAVIGPLLFHMDSNIYMAMIWPIILSSLAIGCLPIPSYDWGSTKLMWLMSKVVLFGVATFWLYSILGFSQQSVEWASLLWLGMGSVIRCTKGPSWFKSYKSMIPLDSIETSGHNQMDLLVNSTSTLSSQLESALIGLGAVVLGLCAVCLFGGSIWLMPFIAYLTTLWKRHPTNAPLAYLAACGAIWVYATTLFPELSFLPEGAAVFLIQAALMFVAAHLFGLPVETVPCISLAVNGNIGLGLALPIIKGEFAVARTSALLLPTAYVLARLVALVWC